MNKKPSKRPAGARGALSGPLLRKGGPHGKTRKAQRRLDKTKLPSTDSF